MPKNYLGEYRPHPTKVSKSTRVAVYIRDAWTCQDCGRLFTPEDHNLTGRYAPSHRLPGDPDLVYLELDHILPRKHGGTNDIENLRAACTPCNKAKLASTRHTKWEVRIGLALDVLQSKPANEDTAKKAAALLLGYLQSELPPAKGLREAGF